LRGATQSSLLPVDNNNEGAEAVSTSEEYRQKALRADLMALRATDAAMRTAYENLAHSWRELARQAEWEPRACKDDASTTETRDLFRA
jgi:hypothetical protein